MVPDIKDKPSRKIGLALSGGGVRAAAYHAGVLRWLAEHDLLEQIEHVSSVSGGSLFTGAVFKASGYSWPTSAQYLEEVFPKIRCLLTQHSLQMSVFLRLLLNPLNWRFCLSRANVVAKSIESLWDISLTLGKLPDRPVWSINGTTAENGRRFRFKAGKMGDYEFGYADAKHFSVASAMAVSAAFPGGIGPLTIKTSHYEWRKREQWNSTLPAEVVMPKFKKIHLYDGGVYDNLGMEPFFDIGKQTLKDENTIKTDVLIVSDAGAPFQRKKIPTPLHPRRLMRVADVALDQARSLRVRVFANFLINNPGVGMYLQIGSDPVSRIKSYGPKMGINVTPELLTGWLLPQDVASAASYRTSLRQMREADFDLIAQHGYETAQWNNLLFNCV